MTTVAPAKTKYTTTWTVAKLQEQTAAQFARQMGTIMGVMEKLGPDAAEKFHHAMTEMKAGYYRTIGAKTPIELVKAMAEHEANIFGSIINVWGDDKEAWLEYEVCGCYNAMSKACNLGEKEMAQMGSKFEACTSALAKEFGFAKGEIKFGTKAGEAPATIHFVR